MSHTRRSLCSKGHITTSQQDYTNAIIKSNMWVLGKIRESMENVPLELNRYMGKSEEEEFFPSKTSFSQNLHSNIITPDNIPEFCLPPRLCKRSQTPEAENTLNSETQIPKSIRSLRAVQAKTKDVKTNNDDASEPQKAVAKPLPFSADLYGLAGMYESPNTRRKESLFHSKSQVFMFERSLPTTVSRQPKETRTLKKTFSGFLPLFSFKNLSEAGNTKAETPSSGDSFPFCSSYKTPKFIPSRSGHLKESKSCPSLIDGKGTNGKWKKSGSSLTTSPCSPPALEKTSLSPSPPVLLSMDVLQCQERLQHEHVLPLKGRGRIRVSAERTAFSSNTLSTLQTVRVRVVSVEGLSDDTERQTLNCAVNLCLTPGKLQQQESATIRKCRSPVFNEDFFFTELSHKDLQELQLRLKVVDKPAAGALRRGTVIGSISKPLHHLLPSHK